MQLSARILVVAQVSTSRPEVFKAFDEGRIAELDDRFARLEADADARELTAATIARVRGSDEARGGVAAFLARQPANRIPT